MTEYVPRNPAHAQAMLVHRLFTLTLETGGRVDDPARALEAARTLIERLDLADDTARLRLIGSLARLAVNDDDHTELPVHDESVRHIFRVIDAIATPPDLAAAMEDYYAMLNEKMGVHEPADDDDDEEEEGR